MDLTFFGPEHGEPGFPGRWVAWVAGGSTIALLESDLTVRSNTEQLLTWTEEPIIAGPFESVEAGKAALVLIASSGGG